VTALGFRFADVKILLGTHAHGDHQDGDAAMRLAAGAQVVVMKQDVPALQAISPAAMSSDSGGNVQGHRMAEQQANSEWRVAAIEPPKA